MFQSVPRRFQELLRAFYELYQEVVTATGTNESFNTPLMSQQELQSWA